MKVFATFGSGHLNDYDVNSIKVMLEFNSEEELRETLMAEPFNGDFCTSYPESHADLMVYKYGMISYSLTDLLKRKI